MSGYIQIWKELITHPHLERLAAKLVPDNPQRGISLALGCLIQLWMRADSHIREDDSLGLGEHEIDKLVGITGFCRLMPADWLEIVDEQNVRLPDYAVHNGIEARKKARAAARYEKYTARHGKRQSVAPTTRESCNGNVEALLPSLPIPSLPNPSPPIQDKSDYKVSSSGNKSQEVRQVGEIAKKLVGGLTIYPPLTPPDSPPSKDGLPF